MTALLVAEEPASRGIGGEGTRVARAIRWAQGLYGGEPRGAVHGSAEPLRHRAAGLPNTWNTVRDVVGFGKPQDDGLWRYQELEARVPADKVVTTVREAARRLDCLGWVGVAFLDVASDGGNSRAAGGRRVCTECFLEKDEARFDDNSSVCHDCA